MDILFGNADFKILFEWIFKILLCSVLVGSLGYNREKKGMIVGIRTHMVVGMGSLLIQLVSLEYVRKTGATSDIFRLSGQYISGIGFLGAGTILKDDKNVKGLTTAATLFFSACLGIAIGSGLYIASILVTIFLYLFLTDIFHLKKLVAKNKNYRCTIALEIEGRYKDSHKTIKKIITTSGADIFSIQVMQVSNEKSKAILKIDADDETDINDVLNELVTVDKMIKAQIINKG